MCNRTIGGLGDRRILAVAAVIALLFVWLVPGFAEPQNSGGVYKVTMTPTAGAMGLKSDCNCDTTGCTPTEGYVLARSNNGTLESDGYQLDANGFRVPLNLDLVTNVPWTRKYDVGRGTSGVFNGCYGEPFPSNLGCYGRLWIMFEKKKVSTVRFQWNFDCYQAQLNKRETIGEHFIMSSDPIPFQAWTGGDISGDVKGTFELKYFLSEGHTLVNKSLTDGFGRPFDFHLDIKKLPLP